MSTFKLSSDNYLGLSDIQEPYSHPGAFPFVKYAKKYFNVPDENCLCVGDETDQYWGGAWQKSVEAPHTANQELEELRKRMRRWYALFPQMKLCESNHGTRYWRKALHAEIPSQLIRRYEEVIEAPPGWKWKKHWLIKAKKKPFIMEHGDDYGGQQAHIKAALHNGMSTLMGHHHTRLVVDHIVTNRLNIWAAIAGSLIDFKQVAFDYAKRYPRKPKSGLIIILDGGRSVLPLSYD